MEEEDPESDIEVGDEAVYLEGDKYMVEDDEDEILVSAVEKLFNNEVEEIPVRTTKPPKALNNTLLDRANATWDLTKVRNICTGENGSFVVLKV